MTDQELLNLADKAKQKAYVPYSKFLLPNIAISIYYFLVQVTI